MEAPERKGMMEGEKVKSEETGSQAGGGGGGGGGDSGVAADSPRDLFAWSQYLHDSQFFDIASLSPKGLQLSTPRDSPNTFPDLSAICPSPLFADHLKFLQSWSPRVANMSNPLPTSDHIEPPQSSTVTPPPVPPVSVPPASNPVVAVVVPSTVSDHFQKQIQSLDLSRVSNSEPGVSNSVTTSCDSEAPSSSSPDVKRHAASTAESTGSGDEKSRTRKRKSAERDDEELENVDDASEADETEELSKDIANKKSSRSKQPKGKGPKRLREPRYAIKTRTEVDIMEDGYKWRKYGQKPVKNSPHPRNYYRCTTQNCPVRKRVERSLEDPGLVVTSYEGTHTHPKVNQPKRTASGNFAPVEAAESLSESLNQFQNRQHQQQQQQQAASASSAPPQLPSLFPGFPAWPMNNNNRQLPPQDNVGLMLAYQIVRLQWELQAKIQQFVSYNAAAQGGNMLPKVNPFMDPFGFQSMSMPDMSNMFGGNSDSDTELKFPKVPEALSSGSGNLLARRAAAQRSGSPLNPNLQSSSSNAAKMQQLMAQMMAGLQQQATMEQQQLQQQEGDQADQQPGQQQ